MSWLGEGMARADHRPPSPFTPGKHCVDFEERDIMNLQNLVYYLRMKLMRNDSGQDLLEYALLVALIALVCVGVITSTGSGVQQIFTNISGALDKATP